MRLAFAALTLVAMAQSTIAGDQDVLELRKKDQMFSLEYLLIAGPDKTDWKWIAPAVQRAHIFMKRSGILENSSKGMEGSAKRQAVQKPRSKSRWPKPTLHIRRRGSNVRHEGKE